jgi:uncharacterized membrane protein YqiK
MTGANIIAIVILVTLIIAIGVYLLHWLYRHSSKDQSFIRTGLGGERVVMGGGAFVVPIVHAITLVNMNAVPVEIRRAGEQSLITRNKMRIDVVAEFFVRVIPTIEGVAAAARTLGERTQNPGELKQIVQARFADALASVAASATMDEIHVDRIGFMRRVGELAALRMATNGLELESAALTNLNQTDISVFNPDNAFDAEGLTQLTEQIESRRQLRNRIENDNRISIKLKDFETEQRALEIDRDLEYARIDQARSVEIRKALQQAEIEDERSKSSISITNARIRIEQESERVRINKERMIEVERINSANEVRALEIERHKQTEIAEIDSRSALEGSHIRTRSAVEAERIESEQRIKESEIRSRQTVALAETAAQAEVSQSRLEKERRIEESRIENSSAVELRALESDKQVRVTQESVATEQERAVILKRYLVEVERLKKDEELIQMEIAKNQKVKLAETDAFSQTEDATIAANRRVDELRIAAQKFIDRFEIEQRREIEIVDKERLIAVVNKSIDEAHAKVEAANAQRSLIAAEEKIETARAEETANRSKLVELLDAGTRAEREALRVVTAARAEREAVEQRAEADIAQAHAVEVRYATDAAGNRLLNESENMRSEAARRSAIYEHLVRTLPNIIRETVKPMEKIESIKILQVDGLPGLNSPSETAGGGGGGGGGGGSMSDRVVNSAMKYRTQVAFVDGLLKDLGLPMEGLGNAGGMSFRNFPPAQDQLAKDDD